MKSLRNTLLAILAVVSVGPGARAADKPLKVFILAGQSNMQGKAHPETLAGETDGPFQNAMAAPADMPESKGNVVAVRTGKYWDHRLGELDQRMVDKVIKPLGRQRRELDKAEARELEEKLIKESFTDEELKLLETGTSNASFHYLGSAKIYSRIGEAFAEALLELEKTN